MTATLHPLPISGLIVKGPDTVHWSRMATEKRKWLDGPNFLGVSEEPGNGQELMMQVMQLGSLGPLDPGTAQVAGMEPQVGFKWCWACRVWSGWSRCGTRAGRFLDNSWPCFLTLFGHHIAIYCHSRHQFVIVVIILSYLATASWDFDDMLSKALRETMLNCPLGHATWRTPSRSSSACQLVSTISPFCWSNLHAPQLDGQLCAFHVVECTPVLPVDDEIRWPWCKGSLRPKYLVWNWQTAGKWLFCSISQVFLGWWYIYEHFYQHTHAYIYIYIRIHIHMSNRQN